MGPGSLSPEECDIDDYLVLLPRSIDSSRSSKDLCLVFGEVVKEMGGLVLIVRSDLTLRNFFPSTQY